MLGARAPGRGELAERDPRAIELDPVEVRGLPRGGELGEPRAVRCRQRGDPGLDGLEQRARELALACDPLGARASQALHRGLEIGELAADVGEARGELVDGRLDELDLGLRLGGGLGRGLGLATDVARLLEALARGRLAIGGELLGARGGRIGVEDQLAEHGQVLAPGGDRAGGAGGGGRAVALEAHALAITLGGAGSERGELRGRGVELGVGGGEAGLGGGDHVVERAAVAPRMLRGAAQRAGLALAQLWRAACS